MGKCTEESRYDPGDKKEKEPLGGKREEDGPFPRSGKTFYLHFFLAPERTPPQSTSQNKNNCEKCCNRDSHRPIAQRMEQRRNGSHLLCTLLQMKEGRRIEQFGLIVLSEECEERRRRVQRMECDRKRITELFFGGTALQENDESRIHNAGALLCLFARHVAHLRHGRMVLQDAKKLLDILIGRILPKLDLQGHILYECDTRPLQRHTKHNKTVQERQQTDERHQCHPPSPLTPKRLHTSPNAAPEENEPMGGDHGTTV